MITQEFDNDEFVARIQALRLGYELAIVNIETQAQLLVRFDNEGRIIDIKSNEAT